MFVDLVLEVDRNGGLVPRLVRSVGGEDTYGIKEEGAHGSGLY